MDEIKQAEDTNNPRTYSITCDIIRDFCYDAMRSGEYPTDLQIENLIGRYDEECDTDIDIDRVIQICPLSMRPCFEDDCSIDWFQDILAKLGIFERKEVLKTGFNCAFADELGICPFHHLGNAMREYTRKHYD